VSIPALPPSATTTASSCFSSPSSSSSSSAAAATTITTTITTTTTTTNTTIHIRHAPSTSIGRRLHQRAHEIPSVGAPVVGHQHHAGQPLLQRRGAGRTGLPVG
jgi:hypothetical protein